MTVETLPLGPMPTNCHIIRQGDTAIIIDPADRSEYVENLVKNCKDAAVFLTHGHFDHIQGVAKLSRLGAKVYVHHDDAPALSSSELSMADYFGFSHTPCHADFTFSDGDEFDFEGLKLRVIHTPGHTPGSCCFIVDNAIFSGDTVFKGTVGRTDTFGGSTSALLKSLEKLKSLNGSYTIYTGHGESTDLSFEKKNNIFFNREKNGLY